MSTGTKDNQTLQSASKRIVLLSIGFILLLVFVRTPTASCGSVLEQTFQIMGGSYDYISVENSVGEDIFVELSFQYVQFDINIFVFDTTNFLEFQNLGSADPTLLITSNGENVSFSIQNPDNWYIVFSLIHNPLPTFVIVHAKVSLVERPPVIDSVTIEGYPQPLSGTVSVSFEVYDYNFYVSRVDVYIDSTLVASFEPSGVERIVGFGVTFPLDTYLWENGNYTLTVLAYNSAGISSAPYNIEVEFQNDIFDNPILLSIVTLTYMILLFLILVARPSWTRKLINPDLIERYGLLSLVGLTIGITFFVIDFRFSLIDFSPQYQSILILIAYTAFGVTGHFASMYFWSRYIQFERGKQDDLDESDVKMGLDIVSDQYNVLQTDQLFSRSDILDKIRSNQRNGMSIILGIGTAIILWTVNLGLTQELTTWSYILLGASFGLVGSIVIGIIISFFRVEVTIDEYVLGEGMLKEGIPQSLYTHLLRKSVRRKMDILNKMRKMVGIGLVVFFVGVLTAILFPVYAEQTLTHGGLLNWIIALFPLSLIVTSFVRFAVIALNPVINISISEKGPR